MKLLKSLFVLSLLFFIIACSNDAGTVKKEEEEKEVTTEQPAENETETETEVKTETETVEKEEDSKADEVKEPKNTEVMTMTAIYVGQVDPHTIEVVAEGETINLQTTEADINFDEFSDGDEVKIEYYKNEQDQYILKSMKFSVVEEKKEDSSSPVKESPKVISTEATYVGQVDTHTIEVTVDGEAINLQTTEIDVNLDEIEEGSQVMIAYYQNEDGQNILKSIE
ncbi:hypothetical protein [Metabacillus fastidiosus]|uniref:hypothetical protein n=1 Tax=Metabacillus fastidiosus TaxID=1458 RepID=UPI002DBC28C9|nr:hypothetical protein [Metabacillus fastidiosus]MEC2077850.1 hypothetical protein [Metabacillus fastidiosus]